MRTASILALLVALSPVPGGLADGPASGWTPELAFKVKRVGSVRISPDGGRVAFVVGTAVMDGEKSEWVSQIHVARSDGTGAIELTGDEKSATAPTWSPDGKWIAFVSARGKAKDGKDPKPNLWRIRVDGGEAEPLTEEKGATSDPRWSPDGSRIAFLRTDPKTEEEEQAEKEKRDARVIDESLKRIRLCVVPVAKDAAGKRPVTVLTPGEVSVGNVGDPGRFNWSPDGRSIVFVHQPTPYVDDWPREDVSVVDVDSGAVRPLAASGASETDPFFSPDGRTVALAISDDPPTWRFAGRIAVVSREGGAPRTLAVTHDEHPEILGWSADGKSVLFTEARGTVNRVSAAPLDGGPIVDLTPADMMVDQPALDASRTRLGFSSQAPDRAAEAYVSALASPFAPVRVSRVQDLPAVTFGRTEVVTWTAPDGKAIEGLLTYPVGYVAGRRVPLLVVIHGGPAGVFLRSFTGAPSPYPVAVFASRGYAVLRSNVRGSSGYGRDFRHANYKDWGGGDYQDILSGVDALVAKGVADPDRLGVMGWSYGGFMTSWIITQTQRFKAASVGAGVTNLMSFAGTADIPSFIPDYFGGEFWDDLEIWRKHSAMFHVKGVKTPTLIQHGEADLRVPISQGYELYNALKRQGVPTRMVVYPRQPHGIQEPRLQLDSMARNLEWFDRWVMGKAAVPAAGAR